MELSDLRRRWLPKLRGARARIAGTVEVRSEEMEFALAEIDRLRLMLNRADAWISTQPDHAAMTTAIRELL